MKKHFYLLNLLGIVMGACAIPAMAQMAPVETTTEAQAAQWEKLKRANSAAKAVHVAWHRVHRIYAKPDVDPEKEAQVLMKMDREKGMDEAEVLKRGKDFREHLLDSKRERVIESTLDFVRIGDSVLCNAVYPAPEQSQRFIEFYDGTHSLHATNEFKGEIRKPSARLSSDPENILYMSAFGPQIARFLLAIPFDQDFSPANPALWQQNAKLRELPDGEWSIMRDAASVEGKSQEPDTLVFGGDGAYLASYEQLYINGISMDKNGAVVKIDYQSGNKIVATQFKQYADGIWLPSKIVQTWPNQTMEYTLIEAQFNENVNPFGLALPPDLLVTDARFGERNIVVYNTTDGRLLTDEEVKMKMVGR